MENFNQIRDDLIGKFYSIKDISDELKIDVISAKVQSELIPKLRENLFYLVVLGEFNAGKTTLINSFLGEDLLPTGITPTTATINLIRFGDERQGAIYFRDGNVKEIPVDDLKQYVTANASQIENIDFVQIFHPADITKDGIFIVDTPGVNDINQQRANITYGYIPRSDVVLFLMDCKQAASESQLKFLREKILKNDISKIFFLINKVDQLEVEEVEEVVEFVQESLLPLIESPKIYPISAKLKSDNSKLFDKFYDDLTTFLHEEKGSILLSSSASKALRELSNIKQSINVERHGLDLSIEELDEKISNLKPEIESKRNEKNDVFKAIDGKIDQMKGYLSSSLQVFCEDFNHHLLKEIEIINIEDIKKYLPAFIQDKFKEWMEEENEKIKKDLIELGEYSSYRTNQMITEINKSLSKELNIPQVSVEGAYLQEDVALFAGEAAIIFFNLFVMSNPLILIASVFAGGGLYKYLKNLREKKFRAEAKNKTKEAIDEISQKVFPEVEKQLQEAGSTIKKMVEDVLEAKLQTLEKTLERTRQEKSNKEQVIEARKKYLEAMRAKIDFLNGEIARIQKNIF